MRELLGMLRTTSVNDFKKTECGIVATVGGSNF
jgi:hypothetical protein